MVGHDPNYTTTTNYCSRGWRHVAGHGPTQLPGNMVGHTNTMNYTTTTCGWRRVAGHGPTQLPGKYEPI